MRKDSESGEYLMWLSTVGSMHDSVPRPLMSAGFAMQVGAYKAQATRLVA